MTRALWLFAKIAVLVAAAVWLVDNPGSVRIDWQGWVVETQLGILALAALILAIVLTILWELYRGLAKAPATLSGSLRARRRAKGLEALTQGLIAVSTGDGKEAERLAKRADALLDEPLLTALLSVQAARFGGDEAAAAERFGALRARPETAFLGVRGLLDLAMRRGDWETAEALAAEAQRLRPGSAMVARDLYAIRRARGDLVPAIEALERAARLGSVDAEWSAREKADMLLALARKRDKDGDVKGALKAAEEASRADPGSSEAIAQTARLLGATGKPRKAEKLIETAWKRAPDTVLARAYRALGPDDKLAQVKRFEGLLKLNPDHAESHIALAEAALAADLWGEARNHLTIAGGAAPPPRVCRLMADLELKENNDPEAARAWAARAADLALAPPAGDGAPAEAPAAPPPAVIPAAAPPVPATPRGSM